MTGMLLSMWKSRYSNCRALLPSSHPAEHWCCYCCEITSIDHDQEWHGKPGCCFCLLSNLQRVFSRENIPFQVRTLAQGAETVKGGLGDVCEVCWEADRRGCEQLSTKQKKVIARRGKSCQSCPLHCRISLLLTT